MRSGFTLNFAKDIGIDLAVESSVEGVKNERSGLSILPFSSLTFIFFLIYFSLFYFQNQGQGQSDKITLSHSRSCKSHDAWKNIEGSGRMTVKIKKDTLDLFYFSFHLFSLFSFSIFRTTRVRVDRSHRHISHLIVQLQDRLQDWGELSRRFENR